MTVTELEIRASRSDTAAPWHTIYCVSGAYSVGYRQHPGCRDWEVIYTDAFTDETAERIAAQYAAGSTITDRTTYLRRNADGAWCHRLRLRQRPTKARNRKDGY